MLRNEETLELSQKEPHFSVDYQYQNSTSLGFGLRENHLRMLMVWSIVGSWENLSKEMSNILECFLSLSQDNLY